MAAIYLLVILITIGLVIATTIVGIDVTFVHPEKSRTTLRVLCGVLVVDWVIMMILIYAV